MKKKTFLFSLLFWVLLPFIANSQNKEVTTIKLYYLMAATPWRLTTEAFDSVFLDSKYCESITIHNKSEVSVFLSEIENLQDTLIGKNNSYEENLDTALNCRAFKAFEKPEMDTRGKMIIMTSDGNTVFYYSLITIWNSTDNLLYKMSDKLRTMITNQFFPRESQSKRKKSKKSEISGFE